MLRALAYENFDSYMKIYLLPCSTISLAHRWGKSESEEPAIGNCKPGVLILIHMNIIFYIKNLFR